MGRSPFRIAFTALLLLAVAAPAFADRQCAVPAGYYRVVNVEAQRPVPMFSATTSEATLLATLQLGDIVLSDGTRGRAQDRTWQRVTLAQTEGWVEARHLWRTLPMTLQHSELPAAGWCSAFAPLWSVHWNEGMARLALYPGRYDLPVKSVQYGASQGSAMLVASSQQVSLTLVYGDGVCRSPNGVVQGLGSAYAIVRRGGTEQLFSGCCQALTASFVKH